MKRSLAFLQECYGESGSDTEEPIKSSMDTFNDKPLSDAVKDVNNDEVRDSGKSKLSCDHQDNLSNRMPTPESCTIFLVEDIPLPPDDFPMDGSQSKSESFSEENISSNKKKIFEDSTSDDKDGTSDRIKEPSPLSPDTPEDKPEFQLISGAAESEDDDKLRYFKSSKSQCDQHNPLNSQVQFPEVPSLSPDDTFKHKLVSFEKESVDEDKASSSTDSKSPFHEDDSLDSREPISEEFPVSPDDTSKNKLQQFEFASACFEDVEDDETSSSEDFKPYDHEDEMSTKLVKGS